MLDDLVRHSALFIHQNIQEVCFSITSIVMVLLGPYINSFVKRTTKKLNSFLRYLIFILLCSAGYGALSQILYKGLRLWMVGLANLVLIVAVVIIFLALALLAKQQREI